MIHFITKMQFNSLLPQIHHILINILNLKLVLQVNFSLQTLTTRIWIVQVLVLFTIHAQVQHIQEKLHRKDGKDFLKLVIYWIYIDLSIIGRGKKYNYYRGNLYRIDKSKSKPTRYLAFNPAMNSPACFHQPLKFV